jgi:hypothetical protein
MGPEERLFNGAHLLLQRSLESQTIADHSDLDARLASDPHVSLHAMSPSPESFQISRLEMLLLRVGLLFQQLEPLPGGFLLKRDLL